MKKRIGLTAVILVSILYIISFFSNSAYVFSFSPGWSKSDLTGFITSVLFLISYLFLIIFYKNKMANYIMLALSDIPLALIVCHIFTYLFNINIAGGVYAVLFFLCIPPFYGFTFLLPTVDRSGFPATGPETINEEIFVPVFYIIALLLLILKIIMFIRLNRKSKKTI